MTLNEEDLKDMLSDDDDEGHQDRCPLNRELDIPVFMLDILRTKSDTLRALLLTNMEFYKNLPDSEKSKKEETYEYIRDILKETKEAIRQYDYIMAMIEEPEEDEG